MSTAVQNTRQNLRGMHDRSQLNRVRLRLYHARTRQLKLADETTANEALLTSLVMEEGRLSDGDIQ